MMGDIKSHTSSARRKDVVYDVIVAGGGLTGAAAYCALAPLAKRHGFSMALCDKQPPTATKQDRRVLALGSGGVNILRRWGLWSQLRQYAYPVSSINLSFPDLIGGDGSYVIEASELGLDAWGWTIPHQQMNSILAERAKSFSVADNTLDVCIPFQIDDFELTPTKVLLRERQQKTLAGNLILSAEGANGILAKGMRVKRKFLYEEHPQDVAAGYAISAGVEVQNTAPNRGYWFWDTDGSKGVLALVPYVVAPNQITWTSVFLPSGAQARGDENLLREDYIKFLRRFSRGMVCGLASAPMTFSFNAYRTEERLKGPLLLLGDAAQRMTPLGGQAYNLTLWTLEKLRQAFEKHCGLRQTSLTEERSFLYDYIIQTQPTMDSRYKFVRVVSDSLARSYPWFSRLPFALLRLPGLGPIFLDLATGLDADA